METFILVTVISGAIMLIAFVFGDLSRTLAAVDERHRIALEMHDVIAHSLQVVISQADGSHYAAQHNPKAATQALETISTTSRSSLAEMRKLLGVLREPDHLDFAP